MYTSLQNALKKFKLDTFSLKTRHSTIRSYVQRGKCNYFLELEWSGLMMHPTPLSKGQFFFIWCLVHSLSPTKSKVPKASLLLLLMVFPFFVIAEVMFAFIFLYNYGVSQFFNFFYLFSFYLSSTLPNWSMFHCNYFHNLF